MESYYGDIGGNLLYKYLEGDKMVSYLQDPGVLLRYGGVHESRYIWGGCGCLAQDNNQPYCWHCWDSKEHQKSGTNWDELRQKSHKVILSREAFQHDILPWIEEYRKDFEECVSDLYYEWQDPSIQDTILLYGDYDIPCGPNGYLLGQYILFGQIQSFFERSDKEVCVMYAYEHP